LIDDFRAGLRRRGIIEAVNNRDTATLFDWLAAALSFQGISDRIAYEYMARHGQATWVDIDRNLTPVRALPQTRELLAFTRLPVSQRFWHLRRTRALARLSPSHTSPAQWPPQPDSL
jgi:hypothetical protein